MTVNPIVSLAGDEAIHSRAKNFNERLGILHRAESDLQDALIWNNQERFGTGFFAHTKPPVPTSELYANVNRLRDELTTERQEIVRLAEGSVKP